VAETGVSQVTLLRSLLIGLLALAMGWMLRGLLTRTMRRSHWLAWALLLAPYLMPPLVVAYAYSDFSLSLIRHPVANATLYTALLIMRFSPLAALVLHFFPSPVSAAALYCHRLLTKLDPGGLFSFRHSLMFRIKAGDWRAPAAAFAVVFLFAFDEFEMASRMNVRTWTVTIFDAHAGGLALSESLRMMFLPVICQLAALGVATCLAWGGYGRLGPSEWRPSSVPVRAIGWIYLVSSLVIVAIVPCLFVLHDAPRGLQLLSQNSTFGREIAASVLYGLIAAILSWCAAGSIKSVSVAVVGLLGPLVLSLCILSMMQLPALRIVQNTPIPLALALSLLLLPFAVLLRRLSDLIRTGSALHVAKSLPDSIAARRLIWRLRDRARFWAVFLLFYGAYWDLTASAILAPVGTAPIAVHLYNLMHYGHTAVLSALVCAAVASSLVVLGGAIAGAHLWIRR
jgi:ABC-type Fe3+ transport system permease subunit